jgi:hypothetical protein
MDLVMDTGRITTALWVIGVTLIAVTSCGVSAWLAWCKGPRRYRVCDSRFPAWRYRRYRCASGTYW